MLQEVRGNSSAIVQAHETHSDFLVRHSKPHDRLAREKFDLLFGRKNQRSSRVALVKAYEFWVYNSSFWLFSKVGRRIWIVSLWCLGDLLLNLYYLLIVHSFKCKNVTFLSSSCNLINELCSKSIKSLLSIYSFCLFYRIVGERVLTEQKNKSLALIVCLILYSMPNNRNKIQHSDQNECESQTWKDKVKVKFSTQLLVKLHPLVIK